MLENRIFPDAVAYGGWQMDEHVRGGIRDLDKIPSRILNFNGCYTIPWRCYYAKDLENVMLAGRDISTTRLGLASTRIIGCCAIGGEAVGIGCWLCVIICLRSEGAGTSCKGITAAHPERGWFSAGL